MLLIEEIEPHAREVYIDGKLYDRRPEPPIDTFDRMTRVSGLQIEDCTPLFTQGGVTSYVLTIRKRMI